MSHFDNVIDIRRPVEFSIDGRAYRTSNRWQAAVNLLLLARTFGLSALSSGKVP